MVTKTDSKFSYINYNSQLIRKAYTTKIQDENITDKIELRKLRKYMLLIEFMESFDLDVLYNTYLKVFYKYSDFVGYA